jgi:hypothetical protein
MPWRRDPQPDCASHVAQRSEAADLEAGDLEAGDAEPQDHALRRQFAALTTLSPTRR